ncbi:hypothetical protein HDU76_007038 [Blyttiomyces sp. JEL0837]|nr:hypothetical protein HDU76_007038 [Blyttiomyces sp. JEL0837]
MTNTAATPASPMADHAILCIQIASLESVTKQSLKLALISYAATLPTKSLTIILASPSFTPTSTNPQIKSTETWHILQAVLADIYVAASNSAYHCGRPLLEVDVLLEGFCGYDPWESLAKDGKVIAVGDSEDAREFVAKVNSNRATLSLPVIEFILYPTSNTSAISTVEQQAYKFEPDLHELRPRKVSLFYQHDVPNTDFSAEPSRLARKSGHQVLEALETRLESVSKFLNKIRRDGIIYDVVPILDDFGPTKDDPNLDAIVGSLETEKGCLAVNAIRIEKGMQPLDIYIIDVISSDSRGVQADNMSLKISSSFIRGFLIKQQEQQNSQK